MFIFTNITYSLFCKLIFYISNGSSMISNHLVYFGKDGLSIFLLGCTTRKMDYLSDLYYHFRIWKKDYPSNANLGLAWMYSPINEEKIDLSFLTTYKRVFCSASVYVAKLAPEYLFKCSVEDLLYLTKSYTDPMRCMNGIPCRFLI